MKETIDLTPILDKDSKKYIKVAKIVEEKNKTFLDFKFNEKMNEMQQILLATCIAKNVAKDKTLNEVFKDEIKIRILK